MTLSFDSYEGNLLALLKNLGLPWQLPPYASLLILLKVYMAVMIYDKYKSSHDQASTYKSSEHQIDYM